MTDLEITRLCARAMGLDALTIEQSLFDYDPLHDDAQCMALVKKLRLHVCPSETDFNVWPKSDDPDNTLVTENPDLNRAVCECVARIQQNKEIML